MKTDHSQPSAAPAGAPAPTEPKPENLDGCGERTAGVGGVDVRRNDAAVDRGRLPREVVGPPARLQELVAQWRAHARNNGDIADMAYKDDGDIPLGSRFDGRASVYGRCADELEALLSSSAGAAKNTKTKT